MSRQASRIGAPAQASPARGQPVPRGVGIGLTGVAARWVLCEASQPGPTRAASVRRAVGELENGALPRQGHAAFGPGVRRKQVSTAGAHGRRGIGRALPGWLARAIHQVAGVRLRSASVGGGGRRPSAGAAGVRRGYAGWRGARAALLLQGSPMPAGVGCARPAQAGSGGDPGQYRVPDETSALVGPRPRPRTRWALGSWCMALPMDLRAPRGKGLPASLHNDRPGTTPTPAGRRAGLFSRGLSGTCKDCSGAYAKACAAIVAWRRQMGLKALLRSKFVSAGFREEPCFSNLVRIVHCRNLRAVWSSWPQRSPDRSMRRVSPR